MMVHLGQFGNMNNLRMEQDAYGTQTAGVANGGYDGFKQKDIKCGGFLGQQEIQLHLTGRRFSTSDKRRFSFGGASSNTTRTTCNIIRTTWAAGGDLNNATNMPLAGGTQTSA